MIHWDYTRRLGYILALTFLFFRPVKNSFAFAFQPARRATTHKATNPATAATTKKNQQGEKTISSSSNNKNIINSDHLLPEPHNPPVQHNVEADVDLEKAQDFASHFGKYSYQEIEHMRNDLHAHRLQNIVPGGQSSDILFLERFLEEDLTSQLESLNECMPDPYLFRISYPDDTTTTTARSKVQQVEAAPLAQKKNQQEKTINSSSNKNKNVINDDHILPESHNPPNVQHKAVVDVDLEKAQDFATHFGKHSYQEIEHMRNDLHAHRLQNIVPGGQSSDILFLERFLEDDLTSQLKSLNECMPDPYLFRYPDHITTTVRKVQVQTEAALAPKKKNPNAVAVLRDEIKDETSSNTTPKAAAIVVEENTGKVGFYSEQLLEEDVLESLAICESLNEGMPDPYLFRDPDDITTTVSKVKTSSNATPKAAADIVKNKTSKFDLYGELLEEGVLQAFAICVMLALFMTAPKAF